MTDSPDDTSEPISGPDDATVRALRALLRTDDAQIDPVRREQSIQAALRVSREMRSGAAETPNDATVVVDDVPINAPVPIASRRVSRRATQVLAAAAAVVIVVAGAFVLTERGSGVSSSQEDASMASGADSSKQADSAGPEMDQAPSAGAAESSGGGASDDFASTTTAPTEPPATVSSPATGLVPLGDFDDTATLLVRLTSLTDGVTTDPTVAADPDDESVDTARAAAVCSPEMLRLGVTPMATATVAGNPVLIGRNDADTPNRTVIMAVPDCNVIASG